MDPETQKALYTNLLLMAYADGKLDAGENAFVEAVRVRAGISVDEAARYRRELASGAIAFRSVGDRRSALLIAKAAIGAVSSDGEFHRSERYALLELGKRLGLRAMSSKRLSTNTSREMFSPSFFRRRSLSPPNHRVKSRDRRARRRRLSL